MKPRPFFLSSAIALISAVSTQAREFEDHYGRIIEAELISHTGADSGVVELRKGGELISVKVELFSEKDRRFIADWMAVTPPKIDYAFRANSTRKNPEATKETRNPSEQVTFEVKLSSLTRHKVAGLRVEYRAYMLDHEFARSFGDFGRGNFGKRRASFTKSVPELTYVEDVLLIEEPLRYNHDFSFVTKPQRIDHWGDDLRDEALGVIVRVYEPGGKLVFEYRDKKTEDIEWEGLIGGETGASGPST